MVRALSWEGAYELVVKILIVSFCHQIAGVWRVVPDSDLEEWGIELSEVQKFKSQLHIHLVETQQNKVPHVGKMYELFSLSAWSDSILFTSQPGGTPWVTHVFWTQKSLHNLVKWDISRVEWTTNVVLGFLRFYGIWWNSGSSLLMTFDAKCSVVIASKIMRREISSGKWKRCRRSFSELPCAVTTCTLFTWKSIRCCTRGLTFMHCTTRSKCNHNKANGQAQIQIWRGFDKEIECVYYVPEVLCHAKHDIPRIRVWTYSCIYALYRCRSPRHEKNSQRISWDKQDARSDDPSSTL